MDAAESHITGLADVTCPVCSNNAWSKETQRVGLAPPTGGEAVHNALAIYCLKCGFMRFHSLKWAKREVERLGAST